MKGSPYTPPYPGSPLKAVRAFASLFAALWLSVSTAAAQNSLGSSSFPRPAVAYSPRTFSPAPDASPPTQKSISNDLTLLLQTGFRSIVTYSAKDSLGHIPEIARRVGFDGIVVMGIWDPFSKNEWNNALDQAEFVTGYCLGNEGLGVRYSEATLKRRMEELREATGRPVTTSEPIDKYLSGPHRGWLLANSDWLFPIAHSFLADQTEPENAVHWILVRRDYLAATTSKPVVIKEAGIPSTARVPGHKNSQIAFFSLLESTLIPFFYFEAFDQPWKVQVENKPEYEAHWGLFDAQGNPKEIVNWIEKRWKGR